jgi:glyoxylase-like metal-dependent hydrolase (beta-lactamase superfamily II)
LRGREVFGHGGLLSGFIIEQYFWFVIHDILLQYSAMRLTLPHPLPTGKISHGIFAARTGTANFFLYPCDQGILCFDSGFDRTLALRQLRRLGIHPGSVTHLFLTHSDFDHAGGAALFPNADLYLSADEEPLITRRKARMLGLLYNFPIRRSYHRLADDEAVAVGSTRVRAIATPGHTPGSMAYLVDEALLFVGDAFKLIDGRVHPMTPYINMDTAGQRASIRKLAGLEHVRLACTGHSGYTWDFQRAIAAYAPHARHGPTYP